MAGLLMALVGAVTGFVLGKRASRRCPGSGRATAGFVPRPFALHGFDGAADDAGRDGPLLAWGMTLPDGSGSALTIDWRNGPSSGITISAGPEQAACLHAADLVWLPRQA